VEVNHPVPPIAILTGVSGHDRLLLPFLEAPDEESAETALESLLQGGAAPVIRGVIQQRIRNPRERQDADDLYGEVLVHMVAWLGELRQRPDRTPIADFRRYTAVVAHRVCDAQLRRQYPNRTRLKSRVRYVLSRHPAFAMRDAGPQGWMCGLVTGEPRPAGTGARGRLSELRLSRGPIPGFEGIDVQRAPLITIVEAVLTWVGGPVELDDLVSALADLTGVVDRVDPPREAHDDADPTAWIERVPDREPLVIARLESREYLARLWFEVCELPVRQRVALLLSLREDDGTAVLPLLLLTGTAEMSDVAVALEWPVQRLEPLWARLPIEDLEIARELSLTRQQVINLRKSARLRLARRMQRWAEHASE
jgi:hypothetical protein